MRSLFSFLILFVGIVSEAGCLSEKQVPGEYLVRVASTQGLNKLSASNFNDFLQQRNFKKEVISSNKISISLNKLSAASVETILVKNVNDVKELSNFIEVQSVEPNCIVDELRIPNDSSYDNQWAHQIIESEKAWDISIGHREVVVAISDSGVDYNHQDLKNNMWVNELELNGSSGIDDDANGYIDDIYGYDTAEDDGDPIPGGSSHGTHVAGIVGAVGNNSSGITGLNWNVKLMAVKGFFDGQGSSTTAALIKTIYYAVDNGADVINCSWGSQSSSSQALRDAFTYAINNEVLPIVAAGNSSLHVSQFSPASISSVVTVAASNSYDELASFSNYGEGIDLMAPGGDSSQYGGRDETILSTVVSNRYAGMRGTSMAAPYVAGLAGLILSLNRSLSIDQVEDIMKSSADVVNVSVPKNGNEYTYKRINAYNAIKYTYDNHRENNRNCPSGGNCSLEGGNDFSNNTELTKNALLDGMGGCGRSFEAKQINESNLYPKLVIIFFLVLPILMVGLLRRWT